MSSFAIVFIFSFLFVFVNSTRLFLQGHIVGGNDALPNSFPFVASIRLNKHHICGGSIIDNMTVLTAAHCTLGRSAAELSIRICSINIDDGEIYQVAEIMTNPNYDLWTSSADISKLILDTPIKFGSNCQPIALAKERPDDGTELIALGWGQKKEYTSERTSKILQAVKVPVFSQDNCKRIFEERKISKWMICAGGDIGKDSCQGDSGGPLFDPQSNSLVGINSWGAGCGRSGYPGVYASISDSLDFIQATGTISAAFD